MMTRNVFSVTAKNLIDKSLTGEDFVINLSNDQAGRLIGFKGETISKLRKRFKKCLIKVVTEEDGKRKVLIDGDQRLNVYGYIKFVVL